jgi:hypothetical protein
MRPPLTRISGAVLVGALHIHGFMDAGVNKLPDAGPTLDGAPERDRAADAPDGGS